MNKYKVHVVPHTHWDREWYFTTSKSKVYLMKDMKEILDVLSTDKNLKYFILDGQASLIDDYLNWCPEDTDKIKELVTNGKLIIGPWYTQTDQMAISGESIVRNMFYGIELCKKLGGYMNIGYMPDSFGQSGQMPQIYRQFGIDSSVFWRGISDHMTEKTEFIWEGSDGSKVFAVNLPYGYYCGLSLPENPKDIASTIHELLNKLKEKATTKNILLPNGADQAPIRKNLVSLLKEYNTLDPNFEYSIDSFEGYINSVKKENSVLETLKGEFTKAKHMRIHKSIFSSRSDLKVMNTKLENYVTNVLEPILTISHSLGNEYPHNVVKEVWKLMFENSAHDSAGACNSDETNSNISNRSKTAFDLAQSLVELHMRLISEEITLPNSSGFTFGLYNPLPLEANSVLEFEAFIPDKAFEIKDTNGNSIPYIIKNKVLYTEFIKSQHANLDSSMQTYFPDNIYKCTIIIDAFKIPSMGYTHIYFDFSKNGEEALTCGDNFIENSNYKITANSNGTITILDKISSEKYENQMIFEDNGDDGDSYNYSPPIDDMYINSIGTVVDRSVNKSSFYEELNLTLNLKLPKNLEERKSKKLTTNLTIKTSIILNKNEDIIRFKVNVNNNALSHRLRVLFNTKIASKFSIADQPFGAIKRSTKLEELGYWEEENWDEMPISIEPMESTVTLANKKSGFSLITNGVKEYEIIGEKYDTIAYTLFRAYGQLGKSDLVYRPGRPSGGNDLIKTPDAQLQKSMDFEFALYIFDCAYDEAQIALKAKKYLSPIQVIQTTKFLEGRLHFVINKSKKELPISYSLMNFQAQNIVPSAIKKCEHSNDILVRIYNSSLIQEDTAAFNFNNKSFCVNKANLKEEITENLGTELINFKTCKLKPRKLQTLLFHFS